MTLDAAAEAAARLMDGHFGREAEGRVPARARPGAEPVRATLVYARDYGRTEKDIIYKIDFDKAFLFVRYLYHVDNGAWRLIHIHLKTENEEPFPKEWVAHLSEVT